MNRLILEHFNVALMKTCTNQSADGCFLKLHSFVRLDLTSTWGKNTIQVCKAIDPIKFCRKIKICILKRHDSLKKNWLITNLQVQSGICRHSKSMNSGFWVIFTLETFFAEISQFSICSAFKNLIYKFLREIYMQL